MAKSAEQKATAAAAKAEAKPTAANVAAAAKASVIASGGTTQAAKAAAASVRNEFAELKNTQKVETKYLTGDAKKAETAANKTELGGLGQTMLSNGFKLPADYTNRTVASTYDGTTGGGLNALNHMNAAADLADQYKLQAGSHPDSNTTLGIDYTRLDQILNKGLDANGNYQGSGPVVKTLNFQQNLADLVGAGTQLTPELIVKAAKDAGVTQTEDKLLKQLTNKGFVKIGDRSGDSVNFTTSRFGSAPIPDGGGATYITPDGVTRYRYDAPDTNNTLGMVGTALQLASFVPGLQALQPIATAVNAANAIENKDWMSLALAGYGAYDGLSGGWSNPFEASSWGNPLDAANWNARYPNLTESFRTGSISPLTTSIGNSFSNLGTKIANLLPTGNQPFEMNNFLDGINKMVAEGSLTQEQAMEAIRAANNAVSGGTWGDYLNATGQGLTQLPSGGITEMPYGPMEGGSNLQDYNYRPSEFQGPNPDGSNLGGLPSLNVPTTGPGNSINDPTVPPPPTPPGGNGVTPPPGTPPFDPTKWTWDQWLKIAMAGATAYNAANPNFGNDARNKQYSGVYKSGLGGGRWGDPTWRNVMAPRMFAEGGLARYVQGGTAGQADKIPALLSDGEFVMDADTVSALGDGNNAAGASALEQMRQNIRRHKRSAPVDKIPPKAKRPEQYLKGAK